MARSAARLDLALPPATDLAELVGQACAAWPAGMEGALRLVCTRGAEEGGDVTVFATVAAVGEPTRRARRDGIEVATVTLGFAAGIRTAAPWLLGGVKSLSYAVNMASQRWALAHGVDDVLWVSADGYALEAPTSTLVWLEDDVLYTVPAATTGILPGTTARWLLDNAGKLGFTAEERMVTPAELVGADGVWLTSSVRGLVEVRAVDAVPRAPAGHTIAVRDLLGFPT
jgi:4-amino-4-deoxychorismate lyase